MMVNAFKKNTFSAPQLGSTHLLGKSAQRDVFKNE